jgi:hypothetical protein
MKRSSVISALALAASLSVPGAFAAPLLIGDMEIAEDDIPIVAAYCEGLLAGEMSARGEEPGPFSSIGDTMSALTEQQDDAPEAEEATDGAQAADDASPLGTIGDQEAAAENGGEGAGEAGTSQAPDTAGQTETSDIEAGGGDNASSEEAEEDENIDFVAVTLEQCREAGLAQ